MSHPSASLATLRPDLGGSMMQFDLEADRMGYIGTRVAPVIETALASGHFGIVPIGQILKEGETARAPGSGYNRGTGTFTPATYTTQEHGWEEPVDDKEAAMYKDYLQVEMFAASRARATVLRNYEKRVAAMLFNATTWTATSITTEWSTVASAVPITDVETAVQAMYDATGLWANALIINRKVFRNLRRCQQIIDHIKYTSPTTQGELTEAHLSSAFDLKHIIVAGGSKNIANEGAAADVSPIWSSEYAMVARVAETNDIREPCVSRTFHYGADGSEIGAVVETYRDETVRGDVVRARMDTDEKVLYTEAAHLLDNITA